MIGIHPVSRTCDCGRCQTVIEQRDAQHLAGVQRMKEAFLMFLGKHKSSVTDYAGKYVIWSPTSALSINYVYESRPDAIKVSYEMAEKNPGQQFLVLKAVGVAQTQRVEFVDLEAQGDSQQPRIRGCLAPKDKLGADAAAYGFGKCGNTGSVSK